MLEVIVTFLIVYIVVLNSLVIFLFLAFLFKNVKIIEIHPKKKIIRI